MKKKLAILSIFLAACFCTLPSFGTTYYLSTTGNDSNSGLPLLFLG